MATVRDFQRMALSLPEATEGAHGGHPDFRVGNKVFASLGVPDESWGMVKLTPEQQEVLLEAEPKIFAPAAGAWGRRGYTHLRLAAIDRTTLLSALTMAWRNTAPNGILARSPRLDARRRVAYAATEVSADERQPLTEKHADRAPCTRTACLIFCIGQFRAHPPTRLE